MDRQHDARRDRATDRTTDVSAAAAPSSTPGKQTRVQTGFAIGGRSATDAHAAGASARTARAATPAAGGEAPARPGARMATGTLPPGTAPAAARTAPTAPALIPPDHAPPAAAPAPAKARAAAPAAAASPAGGGALDGLVDPFMKARWNPAAFWALVAQHGLPGHAPKEVIGELDRWLPLDLSPDARRAIHIAAAVVGGAIDKTVWDLAEKMPAIGPVLGAVHDIADVAERVGRYQELGDPVGAVIAAAGGVVDVAKGLAEHVAEPIALVAGTAEKIDVAASVVEAVSAAGGPAVAGGVAIKEVAHGIAEAVGGLNTCASLVVTGIDSVRRVLDVIEITYDATRVRGLEARAQFDRAGEYKDLMQGQAIELVFGTIKDVIDVGGVVVGTVLGPLGWVVPADFVAGQAIDAASGAVDAAGELTGALRDAVGADAAGLPDVTIPIVDVSLADALRADRPFLGAARASGDPVVDAARAGTVQDGATAQAAAIAARPDWHPELVAALLATPGFSFATAPDALRPTWYIEQVARTLRLGTTAGAGGAIDGLGATIDALGAGLQPAVDLAVLGTNRFLATNLPHLQQLAVGLDGELQRTKLDLASARAVVATLQNLATVGRQTLPQVVATAALVRDRMLATLAGMKVSLPDAPGLDGLEAAINGAIDAARAAVTASYARGIVPLELAVTRLVVELERELAAAQAALAQGGAVYQALDTQYQALKTLIHRGTTLFAQWQPVIPRVDVRGAGTWLRDLAAKWRTAIAIEQGQVPDPWATDIVPRIAAPHVAAWKAAHTAELERAFFPGMVPPAELAACRLLHARGTAAIARLRPDQAAVATPILADALAACEALGGQRGKRALAALWDKEDHLVRVVAQIEGWAGP